MPQFLHTCVNTTKEEAQMLGCSIRATTAAMIAEVVNLAVQWHTQASLGPPPSSHRPRNHRPADTALQPLSPSHRLAATATQPLLSSHCPLTSALRSRMVYARYVRGACRYRC